MEHADKPMDMPRKTNINSQDSVEQSPDLKMRIVGSNQQTLSVRAILLAQEYHRLSVQPSLSDLEANRIAKILELAKSDDILDGMIEEVEILIARELNLLGETSVHYYEDQQAKLNEYLEPMLQGGSSNQSLEEEYNHQFKTALVKRIQWLLQDEGFDPGPIDGVIGIKTMAAAEAFQQHRNLTVDGIFGPHTLAVLGVL